MSETDYSDTVPEAPAETSGTRAETPAVEPGEGTPAEPQAGRAESGSQPPADTSAENADGQAADESAAGEVTEPASQSEASQPEASETTEAGEQSPAELDEPEHTEPRPGQPAEPGQPTEPDGPAEVADPAEPDEPTEPDEPAEIADPAEPAPGDGPETAELESDDRDETAGSRRGDVPENDAEPGEGTPAESTDQADQELDEAGRPDISRRYPDDYVEPSTAGPELTEPHEDPQTWAGDVNPDKADPRATMNCGECARATQNSWEGHPSAAAKMAQADDGEDVRRMTEWAGAERRPATMSQVSDRLTELGPGSSAVVGFDYRHDEYPDLADGGHWFNAVNDGGEIKAVDGQDGVTGPWPPSTERFRFGESDMLRSDAIYFDAHGKVVR